MAPLDTPFSFLCMAEDVDHAEEQATNAYPDTDIVWVVQTDNPDHALNDYWQTE